MNTVISINGPDNIGKTKLIEQLQKKYRKAIVKHFGPIKTKLEGKKVMKDTLRTLRSVDNKLFFLDRCFMGDFVYGPLFRHYDTYTYFDEMVEMLKDCNTRFLFIFMYADENTYKKWKIKPKKDEKVDWQKSNYAEHISLKFFDLANKLNSISNVSRLLINCNNYNSFNVRNKYITDRIRKFIKEIDYKFTSVDDYSQTIFSPAQTYLDFENGIFRCSESDCASYSKCIIGRQHAEFSSFGMRYDQPTSGCGNIDNPDYVFIGEAPGYLGCGTYGIPFYGDRSGYLFYNALEYLGILHSQVYITNTIKCCPKGNDLGKHYELKDRLRMECVNKLDTEILNVRKNAKVIALGRVAFSTLKSLKVPDVQMIYHPAYYLYRNTPAEFRMELKKVCK